MFKHAMIVLGSANGAERCLPWLRRLMDATASRITLLAILEPARRRGLAGGRVVTDEEVRRRAAYAVLQGPAARLGELGFDVKSVVRFDDPVANILEGTAASNVDVIVLSIPFDEPSARWWRRSAVERLFEQTMVPVFVVRRPDQRAA
jgi:nucleotide-binding universal stress UspA family protein